MQSLLAQTLHTESQTSDSVLLGGWVLKITVGITLVVNFGESEDFTQTPQFQLLFYIPKDLAVPGLHFHRATVNQKIRVAPPLQIVFSLPESQPRPFTAHPGPLSI